MLTPGPPLSGLASAATPGPGAPSLPVPAMAPDAGPWLTVLALGGVLLLGAALARTLGRSLPLSPGARARWGAAAPWLTTLAVVGYLLWAVGKLLAPRAAAGLVQAGLVLALLLASWPMVRDAAAGLVLRLGRSCRVGDHVRSGAIEGRVVAMGLRTMTLQTASGAQAIIPYGAVARDALLRSPVDEAAAHQFRVNLRPDLSPATARALVQRAVVESHWSALSRPPVVGLAAADTLEITIFALSPDHAPDVEQAVRDALAPPTT